MEKKNGKELKDAINKYDKLSDLKNETYGQKSYLKEMDLRRARTFFRIRTKMIKCAMNQSSDNKNRAELWKCKACGYVDTQTHILHCPRFKELREGKSLESDEDLVEYFSEVLKIREDNKI